jgi:arginyl-tRNA--protein-N-Asp/Glu arginylyltransferase
MWPDGRCITAGRSGFVDETSTTVSGVYFLRDPVFRARGLGVCSLITELSYTKEMGLRQSYLGHSVRESPSHG